MHVLVAWLAIGAWELEGAVLALTLTTLVILIALLALLSARVLAGASHGLGLAAFLTGGLAVLAFGAAEVVAGAVVAAILGLALFVVLLVATRSVGLRAAWAYLRALD